MIYCIYKLSRKLVAVGSLYTGQQLPISSRSSNAGFSWGIYSLLSLPVSAQNDQGYLTYVACDSTGMKCVAVGSNESIPLSFAPPGLGVGIVYTTTNGGAQWSLAGTQPTPPANAESVGLYSVTCDSSAMRCITVGFYVDGLGNYINIAYYSTNGGSSWSQASLPALDPSIYSFNSLNSVSCDNSGMQCTAVGAGNDPTHGIGYSLHSTDGGQSWGSSYSFLPVPPAPDATLLTSIFCDAATGLKCSAVGAVTGPTSQQLTFDTLYPVSYTTNDGGATWSNPLNLVTVPNTTNNRGNSVVCDSTVTKCIATASGTLSGLVLPLIFTSSDGGASWAGPLTLSAPEGSNGSASITGLSCDASGLNCTGFGSTVINGASVDITYTTLNGGISWSSPTIVPSANVSTTNAVFVGFNGIAGSK